MTEHHLEFLSLTGGCRGSSDSTLVKIPHCWKCHAAAQMYFLDLIEDTKIDDIEGVRKARDFYKSCMNESRFVWSYLHVFLSLYIAVADLRNYANALYKLYSFKETSNMQTVFSVT